MEGHVGHPPDDSAELLNPEWSKNLLSEPSAHGAKVVGVFFGRSDNNVPHGGRRLAEDQHFRSLKIKARGPVGASLEYPPALIPHRFDGFILALNRRKSCSI